MDNQDLEVTLKMLGIKYWFGNYDNLCICVDIFDNNKELEKSFYKLLNDNNYEADICHYGGMMRDDLYIHKVGEK